MLFHQINQVVLIQLYRRRITLKEEPYLKLNLMQIIEIL